MGMKLDFKRVFFMLSSLVSPRLNFGMVLNTLGDSLYS